MIRNKREFTNAVNEMTRRINADLQTQLGDFIEQMGTSEEELAVALDVNVDDIVAIMEGNAQNVPLDTFMKIMIGSNHVLEIKPLEVTPFGGYGDLPRMPRNARMTPPPHGMMPPMGRDGRMTPPPHGMMPPMGRDGRMMTPPPHGMMPPMGAPSERFCGMPGLKRKNTQRPPMGGMVPPVGVAPVEMPASDNALDRMARKDLIDTIRENGWGEELDLATATRSELINFLESKEFVDSTTASTASHVEEVVNETNANTQHTTSPDTDQMARLLAEELERNPHLKDIIGRYVR